MRRLNVPNPNSHQTSSLRLFLNSTWTTASNKKLSNYAAHSSGDVNEIACGLSVHCQSPSADAVFRLQRLACPHKHLRRVAISLGCFASALRHATENYTAELLDGAEIEQWKAKI